MEILIFHINPYEQIFSQEISINGDGKKKFLLYCLVFQEVVQAQS